MKSLHKYCPATTGTAFSPKFILDAKGQNSAFWKISYVGIFATELPEISIWRANGTFQILKISENIKSRGLDWVMNKILFPQTILDKRL